MNCTIVKKLPSIAELIAAHPLSTAATQKIAQDRKEIKAILAGEDPRLLLILGPCSAWPNTAILKFAENLKQLNNQINDALKVVMRVYIQKPRTIQGWTGPFNQPDPFAAPDIEVGMHYTREMMVKVVELGLPIADEALFTQLAPGFLELLSWVAIGARSSEDQTHRVFASGIDAAVGLKNPTHGTLKIAVNSVVAAQNAHPAVLDGYEIKTHGNPYAHLVLRGANGVPNYSIKDLEFIHNEMQSHQIKNPSIIIDTSHDNCIVDGKKKPALQAKIAFEILESLKSRPDLKSLVKGFMIESFLKEGKQKLDSSHPERADLEGLSITDPCLSWADTEEFLIKLAQEHRNAKT